MKTDLRVYYYHQPLCKGSKWWIPHRRAILHPIDRLMEIEKIAGQSNLSDNGYD